MTTDHPAVVAIGVFLAYMVLVGVIWQVTGTRYDALVDSRAHLLRGIALPIGLGALLLAVATTWLGWWHSALFEGSRSGPAWALVVPALFAAVAVINIATIDYRSPQAKLLPLVLVGCLCVGSPRNSPPGAFWWWACAKVGVGSWRSGWSPPCCSRCCMR